MSSDAVVELPPFMRCSNASIFFSNAVIFSGLLLLLLLHRKVVTNRAGDVVKGRREGVTIREKEDGTNC